MNYLKYSLKSNSFQWRWVFILKTTCSLWLSLGINLNLQNWSFKIDFIMTMQTSSSSRLTSQFTLSSSQTILINSSSITVLLTLENQQSNNGKMLVFTLDMLFSSSKRSNREPSQHQLNSVTGSMEFIVFLGYWSCSFPHRCHWVDYKTLSIGWLSNTSIRPFYELIVCKMNDCQYHFL